MSNNLDRVTVERTDPSGNKRWAGARLRCDPVAGIVEFRQRKLLGLKEQVQTFRAEEITGFDVVMVGDPRAHFYAAVLVLPLLTLVNKALVWVGGSFAEGLLTLAFDLLAFFLAFLLAGWIKVPAIRLERPRSQPQAIPDPALPGLGGRDPRAVARDPAFLGSLVSSLIKVIQQQGAEGVGEVRQALSTVRTDPASALAQLEDLDGSAGQERVHIVSSWGGSVGTRTVARRIADVLVAHRYRGLLPDLAGGDRWRAANLRRWVIVGLVVLVSLAALLSLFSALFQ